MSASLMVLLIIAGGVALIYLARISRRNHEQVKDAGIREWDPSRLMQASTAGEWFKLHFFGPQPKFLEYVGPVLAVGVIAFVVVVLVGVGGAIFITQVLK